MKPVQIKAALLLNGVTQAEIAEVTGKERARVNEVINGRGANKDIRIAVANAIQKPLLDVFPDEKFRTPSGRIRIPSDYYLQAMRANA